MWVATVDVVKAFDSTNHWSLCEALEICGIESNVYAEQKGTVSTDKGIDMSEITRGTKQDDP